MNHDLHGLGILLSGTETRSIYVNGMIRSLGFGIAGVFVPIFLLKQGLSLPTVGLFYVTLYSFFAVFAVQGLVFESALGGLKKLMAAGTLLSAVFLATLGRVPPWTSAFLAGSGYGLYWVAVNTDFSIHVRKGEAGSALGKWASLASLPALFAPLAGGVLLDVIGFNAVLLSAGVILLVSLLPFFFSDDLFVVSGRRVRDEFVGELSAEFILQGIIFIASVMWPVYVFVSGKDLIVVGGLSTLAGLALVAFKYFYGRFSDKVSRLLLLRIGAVVSAVVWALAWFAHDLLSLSLVSILLGFSGAMLNTPLFAFFSEYSKRDPFVWMTVREAALCLGRITAAVLFFWFPSFQFLFCLAALSSVSLALTRPVHGGP